MSNDTRKLIHRIYGIAISAVTVIAGARLAWACYGIYSTGKAAGGQIYTRQIVAEAFAPIALSVYLCLALVIGGFILHLLLPPEQKKLAPEKNRRLILDRLHGKADLSLADAALADSIRKQQKARRLHTLISAVLLAVCSAIFLVYACNQTLWPEVAEITPVMLRSVLLLLGCLAIPTGYTVFTAYFCRRSMDKEIGLMKQAAKEAPASPAPVSKPACNCEKWMLAARFAIVVVAAGLLLYGYFTGGIADVIAKAAAICTECVGLG